VAKTPKYAYITSGNSTWSIDMECQTSLSIPAIIVVPIILALIAMGVGAVIGRSMEAKHQDWFYRDGRKPWWL
jgi:hypothetical protein